MDRSLWLLMRLRSGATLRRWKRSLSRPKGIILGVVTAMLFVPWVFSIVVSARAGIHPPLDQVRRFAPPALFGFTLLSLLSSAGEQALYYTPAEVSFLFAGPYRKRQLLGYKLVATLGLCLMSSLFTASACLMISPSLASAFVGSLLLMFFFQMLQMVLGLGSSTLGALAWSRGRRLVLAALVAAAGLALSSARPWWGEGTALQTLERVERSTPMMVLLAPFGWFVRAFTAERATDLVRWGGPCLVVDLALVGMVFALDASYLEATATASARRFAKLQRMTSGAGGMRAGARKTGRLRFRPPGVPWWGGVGPNFWRQMTTALGDPGRLVGLLAMLSFMPILFGMLAAKEPKAAVPFFYASLGLILWISIAVSGLLPYDFRGDIDVMEELKVLPIPPDRLALGQILTPALVASAAQGVAMGGAILAFGGPGPAIWSILAFLVPINLTFYAIENLLFLWYPSRIVAGQFDVVAIGRQIMFLAAKVLGLALGAGLAASAGALAYFASGRSLGAGLVVAWFALVAASLALVPLVGRAFAGFDVSHDVPA